MKKRKFSSKLVIVGASGHGKVVADIAAKSGYADIIFLDDNKNIKFCLEYPVVGLTNEFEKYKDSEIFVAVGDAKIREYLQKKIVNCGLEIATLIHPNAVVASSVSIGKGTVIMAGAVINPESKIGCGCIVNTGATIDHDNNIGDFTHVSVGSHLAGTVSVGRRSWIGAGAVISNNITICDESTIGAGAVVIEDIRASGIYIGLPARKLKK